MYADRSETVKDRVIDENRVVILDTELEAKGPIGIAVDRVIPEKALYGIEVSIAAYKTAYLLACKFILKRSQVEIEIKNHRN